MGTCRILRGFIDGKENGSYHIGSCLPLAWLRGIAKHIMGVLVQGVGNTLSPELSMRVQDVEFGVFRVWGVSTCLVLEA